MQNIENLTEQNENIDCGKFKSVEALLQAYTSLEAEFTRRSQKLKELENKVENLQQAAMEKDASTSNADLQNRATVQTTQNSPNEIEEAQKNMQEMITNAVQSCLHKHLQQAAPPILRDIGGYAKAPSNTIDSIEMAGKLAEEFFKNIK